MLDLMWGREKRAVATLIRVMLHIKDVIVLFMLVMTLTWCGAVRTYTFEIPPVGHRNSMCRWFVLQQEG